MVELLIIALGIFGYALVSERLAMSAITAPMVFTSLGIALGAGGLKWFDLELEGEAVSILVEATLVLVLFVDAIRIDLRVLRRQAALPSRLLGIGMPLTILLGMVAGLLIIPGLGWAEAALLAAVLAPTDAALGQAVVGDPRLPVRIRQALNVESGLNDGIAVPVVTVLLSIATAGALKGTSEWLSLAARQVGFGMAAGLVIGVVGAKLLDVRAQAGEIEGVYRQLATLAVAAGAFAMASLLDGNGFIAAFVAGMSFGHVARDHCSGVQDFTEDEGELLSAITFVLFGAVLVGPLLDDLTWRMVLYAVASLTVVRILPVLIAMMGSGILLETKVFLGWFGPRGLASILFALVVVEAFEEPAGETIFTVACVAVLLSVFAHGLSANPWTGRLVRRIAVETEPMPEMEPADELPTRRAL